MLETVLVLAAVGAGYGVLRSMSKYLRDCRDGNNTLSGKKVVYTFFSGLLGGAASAAPTIGASNATKAIDKVSDKVAILKKLKGD